MGDRNAYADIGAWAASHVPLQVEAARAAAAAREANEERDRFVAEGRERGWIQ